MFVDEPVLHLLACPGGFSQKREARFEGWIEEETADRNAPPHLGPAVAFHQMAYDLLQRDAVQWIAWMKVGSGHLAGLKADAPQ